MKSRRPNVRASQVGAIDNDYEYPEFTLLGKHSGDVNGATTFVQHVALFAESGCIPAGGAVPVFHMAPPIYTGYEPRDGGGAAGARCVPDLAADVVLSPTENNKIKHWLHIVGKQDRPNLRFQHYIIRPHVIWKLSELGRRVYQRFSCAGFVFEAYKFAGVNTIDAHEASLPLVDEGDLARFYPFLTAMESWPERQRVKRGFLGRADLGLDTDGPWGILLPGYLFKAISLQQPAKPRPAPRLPLSKAEGWFPDESADS